MLLPGRDIHGHTCPHTWWSKEKWVFINSLNPALFLKYNPCWNWFQTIFYTRILPSYVENFWSFNPITHGGRGAVRTPVVFCPILNKSSGNPYLKILDLSQLFIADAPMKKKSKNLVLPPRRAFLGHPIQKYLEKFCFNKKKSHIECWVKNRVNRVRVFHFWLFFFTHLVS